MTIVAWIKADAGSLDNRFVLSKEGDLWTLSAQNGSGRVLVSFRMKADSDRTVSGGTVTVGTWTHIVCVYDGTNMVLYQDGVEVARGANSGPVKTSDKAVWIGGKANAGAANLWLGYIEEVSLFQGALSPAQVRLLYGCRNPRLTVVNWNE
jgi:hypothetical protein